MAAWFKKKLGFEWDKWNINKNWVKHKTKSKDAEEVFFDKKALISDDPAHSDTEKRWLLIGKNQGEKFLAIVFTLRDSKIRIISARPANRKERKKYEEV